LNIERIEMLEKFRKEDPDDPFLIYALATEWMKENTQKSKDYFDKLLKIHPDYLGTYYHAASLYIAFGNRKKAAEIYKNGIELAKRLGEQKTLSELMNAYNEFLYDE